MNIFFTILISGVIALSSIFGAYKYVPLSWYETAQPLKYGATITTIQGTDTISSSRTTINDNFTNLNNGKIEVGSTSIAAITTLGGLTSASALATIGTITSGIWNGTAVTVPYGGTGSTTLSSNQVLLGNGTGNVSVVSGYGASGQFLTSNGVSTAPTWTTSSIDQAGTYSWTGSHTWTAAATVTFNTTTMSTTTMATTTVTNLRNNHGISYGGKLTTMTTPVTFGSSDTATTTIFTMTLPANALATSSVVHIKLYVSEGGFNTGTFNVALNYGGVGKAYISIPFTATTNGDGYFDAVLMGKGATDSQYGIISFIGNSNEIGNDTDGTGGVSSGTYSINSTTAQTLSISASYGTSNINNTITIDGGYAEIIN